jgi:hypothetical protein
MCVSLRKYNDEITGQERNYITRLAEYTLRHENDAKVKAYAVVAFAAIAMGLTVGLAIAFAFSISPVIPCGLSISLFWSGIIRECDQMRTRNKIFDACGRNALLNAPIIKNNNPENNLKNITPEIVQNVPISKGLSESTGRFFISFCIQNVQTKECHVETLSERSGSYWHVDARDYKVFDPATFGIAEGQFELLNKLTSGEIITKGGGEQFQLVQPLRSESQNIDL